MFIDKDLKLQIYDLSKYNRGSSQDITLMSSTDIYDTAKGKENLSERKQCTLLTDLVYPYGYFTLCLGKDNETAVLVVIEVTNSEYP